MFDDEPTTKVLLVDDEVRILEALERQLALDFEVFTAQSGFDALRMLRDTGPVDVIISDMRMPRMTGAVFFNRARELWPEVSRILLTGYADTADAAEAINRGSIFRYLSKPCGNDELVQAIEAGAARTRENRSERALLQQTLRGMVNVMSELVSFIDPASFRGANRVRELSSQLARALELGDSWQLELAASMYPLGRVFEVANGNRVSPDAPFDAQQLMRSAGLVDRIPRLDGVGRILTAATADAPLPVDGVERLSTEILRYCMAVERSERELGGLELAVSATSGPDRIIEAMHEVVAASESYESRVVHVADLCPDMVLERDLHSDAGTMLAARGQRLTPLMCKRLTDLFGPGLRHVPVHVLVMRRAQP